MAQHLDEQEVSKRVMEISSAEVFDEHGRPVA